jgi:hypothetical protein
MTFGVAAPLAIWGFLVGFVGWGSCFRLIEPISEWLLPLDAEASAARGVVRLVVAVFAIFAILLALALAPMLLALSGDGGGARSPEGWRDAFGVTFMSSLGGVLVHGLIGRFRGRPEAE